MNQYHQIAKRVLDRLREMKHSEGKFDMGSLATWDWPQGVALYAMMKASRHEGGQAFLQEVQRVFAHHLSRELPPRNINTSSLLLTSVELYQLEPDPTLRELILSWGDWLMQGLPRTQGGGFQHVTIESLNEGQLWDDTLYVAALFLYRAGELMDRPEWREEAVFQFLFHLHYLQSPETGLFYHGFTFEGRHHFGRAFWARGNSWITAGCADFLEWLPRESGAWKMIHAAWKDQCAALLRLQDAGTGRWHTLLDDADSYLETSASAAIAYGFLKGVRLGLLEPEYEEPARKAARGVLEMIREDGVVDGVSYGTIVHESLDYYRNVKISPTAYGQGLVFLMLTELF